MDEKLPVSAHTPREDSFDIAVRGFNRQQVLEYMGRSSQLLAQLEQQLAVTRADVQRARSEVDQARAEAERLRAAQAETKPVHEEVSARLSQILRLAAEEADQERATADAEIAKLRSESQAESERLVSEARAEAERRLAEAHETAERELAEARETADAELQAAREEAERLRNLSQQQSAELIDEAQRRAGAVNEVSDQRLETLTATHGEAVLRLGQIRDVLADLLDRDAAAGSLAQVVDAVMGPPIRPELDTRRELEHGLDEPDDDVVAGGALPPQSPADHGRTDGRTDGRGDLEAGELDVVEIEVIEEHPVDAASAGRRDEETQLVPVPGGDTQVGGQPVDVDATTVQGPIADTAVHEPVPAPSGEARDEGDPDDSGEPVDHGRTRAGADRGVPTRR